MPNCLLALAVATGLTASTVTPVVAQPLTLINCASGAYQTILDEIKPGAIVAGVVMSDAGAARARAEHVLSSSVVSLVTNEDDNEVVFVTKAPVRVRRDDTTCVIFSGQVEADPLPPTTWAAKRQ